METNDPMKQCIELSDQCIEECRTAALFCKDVPELNHCKELTLRCADECEFLKSVFLTKPLIDSVYYETCFRICGNCATECEKFESDALRKCAEVCRKFQLTFIFQTYKVQKILYRELEYEMVE